MKKIILIICAFALFTNSIFAQSEAFKNTISVHYGVSAFNLFSGNIEARNSTAITDSVKYTGGGFSNIPTIGIAWDYGVAKWFSVGIAASYNQAKASVTGLEVRNNKGTYDKLGDFAITVPRTTVATRLLFHYGNKGRLDCYSGFRFGVGIWSVKTTANIDRETLNRAIDGIANEFGDTAENIKTIDDVKTKIKSGASFVLPQVQLIAFGLRGYVTENIGLNGELAIGSPYFVSIGANYRF
jgi:hypothetical protein